MDIYCLKIKQLRLEDFEDHAFHYFPYDRVYLVPKRKKRIIKKLFKYSFVMEVTPTLKTALRAIDITKQRTIGIRRDNAELKWKETETPLSFLDSGSWVMAVPTYAVNVPPTEGTKNATRKSKLAYVLTYAIYSMHNTEVHLPSVLLHTPKETIPLMCSVCANIPKYYANECSPGRYTCRNNIAMEKLPLDRSFREGLQKSKEGGGEIR